MMGIATRIRTARLASGRSQAELARLLDVSRSAVAQWESPDGSDPSAANLARLATMLECSFEWLATGRGGRLSHRPRRDQAAAEAVQLRYFAHDDAEENLLAGFRTLDGLDKKAVAALIDALSHRRRKAHPRRRTS
jgi:transcriptional regulator with XRE-family HTH domain